MPLEWKIKRFKELSVEQTYNLLQLRSEVFVVEQNCVYQDIDGKDHKALHLIGEDEGMIVAYARLFDAGDYFEKASIGRVVVKPEFRAKKYGHDLMREAITAIQLHFDKSEIAISAQMYLERFYQEHGFKSIGEPYLEDDIPHIEMRRT